MFSVDHPVKLAANDKKNNKLSLLIPCCSHCFITDFLFLVWRREGRVDDSSGSLVS